MAQIHSYQKEKDKRSREKADYRTRIREHKLKGLLRGVLLLLILAILIVLVAVQHKKKIYTSYETLDILEREMVAGSREIRLGDSILTYSNCIL